MSRYLVLYHYELQNANIIHPGLNLNIGFKRTNKPFSRSPIDYTLEITINALSKTAKTVHVFVTPCISASQRWSKSHSMRTQVISHVISESRLKSSNDITKELRLAHKLFSWFAVRSS